MRRLLARFVVPAVVAMGASAPALAGKSSVIVVGPGVVVHFAGHGKLVERRFGHGHRKHGVHRHHGLDRGKAHRFAPRHPKRHGRKLHRHEPHHAGVRRHESRAGMLHSRPLSRHFSRGRHGPAPRSHRRTRQFFHGDGVSSRHHGRRFSSGRRLR